MPRMTPADLNALAEQAAAQMTPEMLLIQFAATAAQIGDHYTLRNRFLMWIQMRSVRQVAGFDAWRKQGRNVRKGEHGLGILAPVTRRNVPEQTDTEQSDSTKTGPRAIAGCKVAYVFDISQTDPLDASSSEADGHSAAPGSLSAASAGPAPSGSQLTELLEGFIPHEV